MLDILKDDLWRYEGERSRSWWMPLRYILFTPGYQYTFFLRNSHVPDNSIVIGNPGKIISREESPTAKYIVYSV